MVFVDTLYLTAQIFFTANWKSKPEIQSSSNTEEVAERPSIQIETQRWKEAIEKDVCTKTCCCYGRGREKGTLRSQLYR